MMTSRIELFSWEYTTDESANHLDIDWPRVQQAVGVDQIKWLRSQHTDKCQMVLDKSGPTVKLMAEFYDQKVLTAYHLMWAK
jgi:hypothetical protein